MTVRVGRGGSAHDGGITCPPLQQRSRVRSLPRRRPADHERLAAQYEQQAKEARAEAETHRKIVTAYRKQAGAIIFKLHFGQHCEALVRSYTNAAQSYEALAKGERQMAKETK